MIDERGLMDGNWPAIYERTLDCVHCGLCLPVCPTYRETGRETSSPRGRIYMLRAVAENRSPLSDVIAEEAYLCLGCRASSLDRCSNLRERKSIAPDCDAAGRFDGSAGRCAGWSPTPGVCRLPFRSCAPFSVFISIGSLPGCCRRIYANSARWLPPFRPPASAGRCPRFRQQSEKSAAALHCSSVA